MYFKRLALSDKAGWLSVGRKNWVTNRRKKHEDGSNWLQDMKVEAVWRCSTGDGMIDQSRMNYEVEVGIEELVKFIMLLGPQKCAQDRTTIEMFRVDKVDKDSDVTYGAVRMPWPFVDRDYLCERFVERSNRDEFVVVLRSSSKTSTYIAGRLPKLKIVCAGERTLWVTTFGASTRSERRSHT